MLFIKIALTGGVAFLLYDVPGTFDMVMYPFRAILEFHDPLHPENSPMHEWFFRSGLDHYVWVFGMYARAATWHARPRRGAAATWHAMGPTAGESLSVT